MGLNAILISDLEVAIERRVCPCTKIEIPLKFCKDRMLVPVPVSVIPVPKVHWYSNSLGVSVPLYLVPIPLLHCMWVPVPVSVVPVPLPPQLHLFTLGPLGASRQRLYLTTMIYSCSLEPNRYENVHGTSNNLHTHQTGRKGQKHLFYTKGKQNMS